MATSSRPPVSRWEIQAAEKWLREVGYARVDQALIFEAIEEMHRVEQAFTEIFDEAIRLGGTITGEHGVGVAKKGFLPKFAGDAQLRVMRELRRALDPNGILNPGKMFD